MLSLALGLTSSRRRPWWLATALFVADFANLRFMRTQTELTAADAFSLARSSAKWAQDLSGTWKSFAANLPARTDLGLSLEPAGVNVVPNPSLAGAVVGIVGSGGALPTGWSVAGVGLVTQVLALTTLAGLPAITLRSSGIATGIFYELSLMPDAAVSPSQPYCASMLLASADGVAPVLEIRQGTSAAVFVASNSLPLTGLAATPLRFLAAFVTQATTALARLRLTRNLVAGQTYAFEVTIACPQLETGIKPTSPLLAARAADVLTLQLPVATQTLTIEHDDASTATVAGLSGTAILPLTLTRPVIRKLTSLPG